MTQQTSVQASAASGVAPLPPIVEISSVSKSYGNVEVLHGVDFRVMPGEVVAIIGPSGSGKSTLLRCINHLEQIDSGTVVVADELIGYRRSGGDLFELPERLTAKQRRATGMVFQSFNLFPHLTVLENITLAPLKHKLGSKAEVAAEAHRLLGKVGLGEKAGSYPGELSGGQIGRASCRERVL